MVTKDLLIKFMDEMIFDWVNVLTSNVFLSLDVAKNCASVFAHESAVTFTAASTKTAKASIKTVKNKTRKVVRRLFGIRD